MAIVHDWLETPGGAELVLDEMLAVFPGADVFTMIDRRSAANRTGVLSSTRISTSWLQWIPAVKRNYRLWLPVMPLALRSLDVSDYDIVISNSHAVAKGIRTHSGQLHLCYCLSPMRYAWDLKPQYMREAGLDHGLRGAVASAILDMMRRWDLRNTPEVDAFATISTYIRDRIERAYGRHARVIFPPVDTTFFTPGDGEREDFYVTASRFVPYKRVDLIAAAFKLMPGRRLVIIGDGPDAGKVSAAAGANVEMVGRLSRHDVRAFLRRARAFVFAADEDFGIAPVEAQACGTPVIACALGGVLETVRGMDSPEPTGVLYAGQTAEALANAITLFESMDARIDDSACRKNALRFRAELFRQDFRSFVDGEFERIRNGP